MEDRLLTKQSGATRVSIRNVTKRFGDVVAVNNASLCIEKKEFMTFLGPSGCGKTTLLSMILGSLEVISGEIYFNDIRVDYVPMHKRNVGMVFQNYALFPHMTVAENIGFGLKMRKVPKKEKTVRIREALEMVQLSNYGHRFPKELSGGQRQRVALARALVIKPRVLLLDEPLSNLDAKLRENMRIELKRLHQELGVTIIYVTHDQVEALSLSDKIAVMSEGVIQQISTPRGIFLAPANKFVANFVGFSNFFKGKLIEERENGFIFEEKGSGFKLEISKERQHNNFKVGDKVIATTRAEDIRLNAKISGMNQIKGKVIVSAYAGNTTSYELRTEYGDIVKVDDFGYTSYADGKNVNVYFDPDKVLILEIEEGQV